VVKIQVEVAWVVMPCSSAVGHQSSERLCCLYLHPEDGVSKALRNICILSQHCTASQPRRPRL